MENNTIFTNACPYCGAAMNVSPDQKTFACEYCGRKIFVSKQKNSDTIQLKRQNSSAAPRIIAIIIIVIICVSVFWAVSSKISSVRNNYKNSSSQSSSDKPVDKSADPFEGLTVTFEKYAPHGKVSNIRNTANIGNIEYSVDKTQNLSNGDVLTITAQPKKGYVWTRDTYTYTVSELDTVITEESQISAEDLQTLQDFCIQKIDDIWIDIKRDTGKEIIYDIEPYKFYFRDRKEESYISHQTDTVSAFKVTFTIDEITGTVYQHVDIPDTFIRPDGTLRASYDTASTYGGSVWLEDFGIKKIKLFDGFKTALELEAYIDNPNYILYK